MKPSFFLFALVLGLNLHAQKTFQKAVGTAADETAKWVELGNDPKTFVVCGNNGTAGSGIAMKFDETGSPIWTVEISESGTTTCNSIIRSAYESGYLICGNNSDKGVFAMKLKEDGQLVWKRFFNGVTQAQRITKISDGYVVSGVLANPSSFFVAKINENGDLLWSTIQSAGSNEAGWSTIERANGDLWCFGAGVGGGAVFYFDSNGNELGSQSVGGTGSEAMYFAETFPNGDIVCGDHSWSWPTGFYNYDAWVTKFSEGGNFLWSKTYASKQSVLRGMMRPCSDDGLILAPTDYTTNTNDGHLIKTDIDGNVEWAKSYGESGNDRLVCALEWPEGGFLAVGVTNSFGSGLNDFFIVKTNLDGTIGAGLGCTIKNFEVVVSDVFPEITDFSTFKTGQLSEVANSGALKNVNSQVATLCESVPTTEVQPLAEPVGKVVFFNVLGQKIDEFYPGSTEDVELQFHQKLKSGVYFYCEYGKNGQLLQTKKAIAAGKN